MSEQQNRKHFIKENPCVLVILLDAYGGTENYPIFYANAMYLTEREKSRLHRSIPTSRKFHAIIGCRGGYDFGHDNEGNPEPDTIWETLPKDEMLSEFTNKHKCQVYLAYANE